MNKTNGMHILLVVNPKSGSANVSTLEELVKKYAGRFQFVPEIYLTKGKHDQEEIKQLIKTFSPQMIIAVGGDGTINMLAPLLLKTKLALGIIPAGSANGLAYNLDIPNNAEKALKRILEGQERQIDCIQINERYCLHLSDIGINARIVKRFEEEQSKGLRGYAKHLLKELFSKNEAFLFRIKTKEGINKKRKAEMVVIANAQAYGTGARINPQGKIDDGLFEVIVIKPYPWWSVVRFVYNIFAGRLHTMKYVKVYRSCETELLLKTPQIIQIDGEIVNDTLKINLKLLPGAIRIVC